MSALFDAITFEAYISGAWVNITEDVLHNPAPRWNMGIMGNGPTDRIGDPEALTFSLKNGVSCSGGVIGYYTPGHPNCRTGWNTGIPVRLSFTYDGLTRYKFYGAIEPSGITTAPGLYGERKVDVVCEGWLSIASRHVLDLMSLQTNLTIVQAVPYVLANMPVQPLSTSYGTGVDTFPTVFDTLGASTTALSELTKLALSEYGYIYTRGGADGQTLVVEGRSGRTNQENTLTPLPAELCSNLLLEDGTDLLLEDGTQLLLEETTTTDFNDVALPGMSVAYGDTLANRISLTSYPRKVDAAATTVLFTLQRRVQILAGASATIRGRYRDPAGGASYVNGRDMVTPVSGTDYTGFANSDGTGTNYTANLGVTATFGTSEAEWVITNNGATALWAWVQARGKGIYIYDPVTVLYEDASSQTTYGIQPLTLDMPYQDDPLVTQSVGTNLIAAEAQPHTSVNAYPMMANRSVADMLAFMILEPGTRARFAESVTGIDANYFINGYSAELISGKYVMWSPVLVLADDTNYWQLDIGDLDTGAILDT